ncbi:hypothetical protein D6T17_27535 [Salmonella enterica subsp. enterica serovar Oranienburg]|nr:hypothetical protein [Salmonella enterica subsp. enterica serovar Oranienburg]EBY8947972.1 hypothetical protein [Salmonella enterica subsp. enterica serovar Oranienburg]
MNKIYLFIKIKTQKNVQKIIKMIYMLFIRYIILKKGFIMIVIHDKNQALNNFFLKHGVNTRNDINNSV